MKAYRATGSFRSGKHPQPFSVDIVAESEEGAKERILSTLGSRHRVSRRFVQIDALGPIDPSESSSPVVMAHFRGQ